MSKKWIYALEFETPVNKFDLIRFIDNYGRASKPYEGKSFAKKINSKFIKFKNPDFRTSQFYKVGNVKISLEKHKNFKKLINKSDKTIFGILNGKIVDKKGRKVISYGDIIKTGTLKKLSEIFKIKKQ